MKARHIFFLLLPALLWAGAAGLHAQSAQVKRTWLEHGVTQDGEQGMMAHVEFDVQDMKGVRGEAVALIQSPKGTGWPDTNDRYCTTAGNVCASTYFTPSYDRSHFKDLEIFFPYSEMHLAPDEREYFCIVYIHDSNEYIANGEYVSFNGTGGSGNTPAPQQQAGGQAAFPDGQTLYFANEAKGRVFQLEFRYDNEGDAICTWHNSMMPTSFVLKSRDGQGFHFRSYTFSMEMQTTSTFFGNISTPTGGVVKTEGNQEFTLANDLGGIRMFGEWFEAVTKQEYSRIFVKINGGDKYTGGFNGGNPGSAGNPHIEYQERGSQHTTTVCKYCGGSGLCSKCHGSGAIKNMYSGDYMTCPSCSGNGRCFNCHGSGKQR